MLKKNLFLYLFFIITTVQAQDKDKIEKLLKLNKVQGASFVMGNPEISDAKPHRVRLKTFYIQTTELTQELWQAVMEKNPSGNLCNDCPVGNLSWIDIQSFIEKLNNLTGKKYRLPTEAEWEFASRGGKLSKGFKFSGADNLDEVAWHEGNSDKKIHAVALKKPNELGLYDMSGNVWEWCQDWYAAYSTKERNNPKGPTENKTIRVLRGGSSFYSGKDCQNAARNAIYPDSRHRTYGFRLVLTK